MPRYEQYNNHPNSEDLAKDTSVAAVRSFGVLLSTIGSGRWVRDARISAPGRMVGSPSTLPGATP